MAADILAVPISTVASESTFSAGGRVIDEFRSKLNEESIEALICGGDWLRHKYNLMKKAKVITFFISFLLSTKHNHFQTIFQFSNIFFSYLKVVERNEEIYLKI